MKKPKKITRTPSARAAARPGRTRAKIVEAKPDPAPKTSALKRVTKSAAKDQKVAPLKEIKPVEKVEAVAESAPKVKAKGTSAIKRASAKKLSKVEPTIKVESVPQTNVVKKLEPQVQVSASSKIKPPEETKPGPEPKSLPKTVRVPEVKPVAEAKPSAKAKSKALPKTSLVATKTQVKVEPTIEPKPAMEQKPVPEPKPIVELKPKASAKSEVKKPSLPPSEPIKQSTKPVRKAPARIPPILLEGDKHEPVPISGPGERYVLGPTPPVEKLQTEGELPKSYGTGSILLTARDPHWLYAHWDLTDDQQRRYNAFSRDGHLVVRVYIDATGGRPVAEVHAHPESRHWFVHVEKANTRYVAELGYYSAADKWTIVATSSATLTPPDAVSADNSAEFGTIPFEVPMDKLLSLVKEAVQENAPLAQALQELRAEGHVGLPEMAPPAPAPAPTLPAVQSSQSNGSRASAPHVARPRAVTPSRPAHRAQPAPWKPSEWTPAQERALAEVISMDHVRRVWMGSLEITELIRRQLGQELAGQKPPELGAPAAPTSPSGGIVTGIFSPSTKGAQPQKGFWFNVNAELIVYGSTEPDATVTIAGRKIKLRADGSFSYRFALPDGNYDMPVVAVSADQTDGRAAELKFSRQTEYHGHVGAHPQDPALKPLLAQNF